MSSFVSRRESEEERHLENLGGLGEAFEVIFSENLEDCNFSKNLEAFVASAPWRLGLHASLPYLMHWVAAYNACPDTNEFIGMGILE